MAAINKNIAVITRKFLPKAAGFFAANLSAKGPAIRGPRIETNGAIMLIVRYSLKFKPSSKGFVECKTCKAVKPVERWLFKLIALLKNFLFVYNVLFLGWCFSLFHSIFFFTKLLKNESS